MKSPHHLPTIALIPGFATDTRFSFFRDPWGPDAGFRAFRPLVERGDAIAFRWGLSTNATLLQTLNPFFALNLYRAERRLTEQEDTQKRLVAWLEEHKPHTIVCHSLGCGLLAKTIATHRIPASIKTIVFNQADTSFSELAIAIKRAPEVTFINTYCPWDPSLLLSSLLSQQWRVGLGAVPMPGVTNIFFPLWRLFNLHMSTIRDPRFRNVYRA